MMTKRFICWCVVGSIGLLISCAMLIIVLADWRISDVAKNKIVAQAEQVVDQDVVLVLGTSPQIGSKPNYFYVERIRAVVQLWQLGKVRAVLVSGDNSTPHYNEPDRMKRDLVAAGIPPEFITCDYAGLRTYDSIARAGKIFGLKRVVIVSQREHLERALYLASAMHLDATGLAAADAPNWWQVRQQVREALARVKAMLDIAVELPPKHLGLPIVVPLAPKLATSI
ncbi:SanA/YdcF family protein [Solimicrobium silvestre]|uniref:Putative membrane protein n=1 Tax=Solimicrobium silvestre TaxID=2099400 RepID=A0A2S9GWG3_9BURK|nr:ElyC/SanA/YdcF family protein [Solimicrobium silvestre]PRC92038.1 putative membrane protein [Solimicrobium silvestre]